MVIVTVHHSSKEYIMQDIYFEYMSYIDILFLHK